MGLFGFGKASGPKKPKKFIEVNPGPYKVQVRDTNSTQDILAEARSNMLRGTSGISIALCERTPEQIEEGFPSESCLNVCTRRSKFCDEKNYMGYIDVDHAHVGYLKQLVEEYQIVEAHGSIADNGGKFRMNVLLQPPEDRKKKKQK